MTGTTFRHYRIEERLGTGGMGTVYRATDVRLGRVVALKFLNEQLLTRPDAVDRFRREAGDFFAQSPEHLRTLRHR
jgi:eukaryotic-like serine/threonine-protein kinase